MTVTVVGKGRSGSLVVRKKNDDGEVQDYDKGDLNEAGLSYTRKKPFGGWVNEDAGATAKAKKALKSSLTEAGYDVSFSAEAAAEPAAKADKKPAKKGRKPTATADKANKKPAKRGRPPKTVSVSLTALRTVHKLLSTMIESIEE